MKKGIDYYFNADGLMSSLEIGAIVVAMVAHIVHTRLKRYAFIKTIMETVLNCEKLGT